MKKKAAGLDALKQTQPVQDQPTVTTTEAAPGKKKSDKVILSKREKEILQLIANGSTSKEIAETLFIAKTTVDTHRKNMIRKLNLSGGNELIKYTIDKKYQF